MEALNQRFNALEDQLMDIYEKGSDKLEDQIRHWNFLRKEQILLHYARRRGIMRLGYTPVPSLAASETKAKDAIYMVLQLEKLRDSPYKDEPWTLIDTSLETYRAPPANCFKKGPQNVEVIFDADPENMMLYTAWQSIYFEDTDGHWQKTEGRIDYAGLYYMEGQLRHYYVEFKIDARRFGTSGEWEVRFNGETIFAPVTSSSPSSFEEIRERVESPDVPEVGSATDSGTLQTGRPERTETAKGRRYGRKESSPTVASLRGRQKVSRPTTRKAQERRSRSPSSGTEQAGARGRGQRGTRARSRTRSRSKRRSRSSSRTRSRRAREHSESRGGRGRGAYSTRSRSRSAESRSIDQFGIPASQVGRSVQSVGRKNTSRLERLLAEAVDPPVILLRGEPNILKCYRYRVKDKLKGYFDKISTTWSWVGSEGNTRIGRARMLLSFISENQREQFINTMRLPKGVDWSFGSFDSL